MEPRNCYCRDDRPPQPGIPPGYCGICRLCGLPGHTRHHPGSLPYTGSWCDAHYDQMYLLYLDAYAGKKPVPGEPAGLPRESCRYVRVPAMFSYRRFFRRYFMDAYIEFRCNIPTRYALLDLRTQAGERHERWDHPLSMWMHPYPLERDDSWQDSTEDEFDRLWQHAAWPKNSRRGSETDNA